MSAVKHELPVLVVERCPCNADVCHSANIRPVTFGQGVMERAHAEAIAHRCNAYPKLVSALKEYMAAQERRHGRDSMNEARARADLRDLLRELGETE